MKYCPECGTKLVSQKFCQECGENLSKYFAKTSDSLDSFDFSALEREANKQLTEQIGLQVEGQVLVKYTGKSRDVVIPKGITEIFDDAFNGNEVVATVEIPEGVKLIGKRAFQGCRYLKKITIPSTVEEIYENAFYGCSELEEVTILGNLTQIRQNLFYGCHNLKSINIPKSVTAINNEALSNCRNLTNIYITDLSAWCKISGLCYLMAGRTNNKLYLNGNLITNVQIPEDLTSICDYAFAGCSELTGIYIPRSVTSIGNKSFFNCTGLMSIINISYSLTSIGNFAFSGCGFTELTIPANVKSIGQGAFSNCQYLTDVVVFSNIPSVQNENDSVFFNCPNVNHVCIKDGVTEIGNYAFKGCNQLTKLDIADSVTTIGVCAFNGCTGLTSINIPNSVTAIGARAFNGCTGLTEIVVPNSVVSIGCGAFGGCAALEKITLPFVGESKTAVNEAGVFGYIFSYTTSSPNVQAVKQYSKSETIWGNTKITDYYYYVPASLKSVTITDTASIPPCAFNNCHQLTDIKLPKTVTKIGNSSFANCTQLPHITLPKSVESIGAYAFMGCSSLTSITIPDSVNSIGTSAFSPSYFANDFKLSEILVSENNVNYKSIDGVLYSKDGKALIQYPAGKTTKQFTVPKQVITIKSRAFEGCINLISLSLFPSVENIEAGAFYRCSNLVNLTIPFVGRKKPTSNVGEHFGVIFYENGNYNSVPESLKNVWITDSTHIPDNAFERCRYLESVYLSYDVTYVGYDAFYFCEKLTHIRIPSSTAKIHDRAFDGCNNLKIQRD